MLDEFKVCKFSIVSFQQAMSDARFVHLYAEEIHMRTFKRLLHERVAVTEAYLKHNRGVSAEQRIEVNSLWTGISTVRWP